MVNNFHDKINNLIADNRSGSTEILNKLIEAILELPAEMTKAGIDEIVSLLNDLLKHHSGFVVLFHFVNEFFIEIEKNTDDFSVRNFTRRYVEFWSQSQKKASSNLIEEIDLNKKAVLLHSNSSAIKNLFSQVALKKISPILYQTNSGPVNEGKIQADYLSKLGFKVNFVHESAIGKFMNDLDMAIFGADLIDENGFLNKTGTLPITLLFDYYDKPVYVISESRKMADLKVFPKTISSRILREEKKPPTELWTKPPPGIKPINYYFEFTPGSLVTKFYY